ncbi:MAG: hypothetical protein DI585_03595 [Pseudomonas fluorescens]|nr:MAG: hypothetical protein DI585_03595 [Pseudomonas fluorescens]
MIKSVVVAALAAVIVVSASVSAQERAAGSALDTQVTWTALSSLAQAANDKADGVNARVDQVVVCGKDGKLYAPGKAGADSRGCVDISVPPNVTTQINNVDQSVKNLITNMQTCSGNGQIYNGAKCAPRRG